MRVAFLYPGVSRHDALPLWVAALRRHCRTNEVFQATSPAGCAGADVVLALTQREQYPPRQIDEDLISLRAMKLPFGVVHNQDSPPVPAPGDYPSFVWTLAAQTKLAALKPWLLRMPVLPRIPNWSQPPSGLHVVTFGAC